MGTVFDNTPPLHLFPRSRGWGGAGASGHRANKEKHQARLAKNAEIKAKQREASWGSVARFEKKRVRTRFSGTYPPPTTTTPSSNPRPHAPAPRLPHLRHPPPPQPG